MDLPAEIRNQIYSYLFPPQRVQVLRQKDRKNVPTSPTRYRLFHIQLPPRDPKTQNQKCLPYLKSRSGLTPRDQLASEDSRQRTKPARLAPPSKEREKHIEKGERRYQAQLSLPFTCKQSYNDTVCLLYAATQFVFPSPKTLSRFLDSVSSQAQAAITHVELKHSMYNEPRLTQFREIKLRSDRNFYVLCERITKACEGLSVLHIKLAVFDAPIMLEVGEQWSLPILAFAKLRRDNKRGLRFARVRLECNQFADGVLRCAEQELVRELMDPVAVQVREDEKMARDMSGVVKAMKVLRVVFS
ncbi:hypothetical protein BJX61DRAFT_88064 [Aspergillus egyptiacus]|nr:hypothetical protein BJX61DRAFT_88064 [Aspergillus egyptiacus]